MIRNLILDWSGTLCDDEALTLSVTNEVLAHYGAGPLDAETYRREFCIPVEGFYHRHTGPVPRAELDQVFFAAYRRCLDDAVLFPHVRLLLELAQFRGVRTAVLSTMDIGLLEALIERNDLGAHLDRVRGNAGDKIPALKELLSEQGWAPDETLFVGDTPHDLEAAHAAGCMAGAAAYGYSSAEKLQNARPDHWFEDTTALVRHCDREQLINTERRAIATVGGLVYNGHGEVLLVRTRKWSNKYGLPGGKIDYGETMEAAYKRELWEETGLRLDNARWLVALDSVESPEFHVPRHFLLINYFSTVVGRPELRANYESQDIGWFGVEQALDLDLNQPTRAAIMAARDRGWLEDRPAH
ncbi:MAG: NUDIX domain-containing protein [Pseudomonadota bacterium]|nr:NUDIX domain-containing protein [Pseudomonadota bacterium]